MGDQTCGESGAANGEKWLGILFEIPQEPACLFQHGRIDAVEKNSRRTATRLVVKLFPSFVSLKGAEIDQPDGKIRLLRKVNTQISFVHRRRRVMGHRRMTVDAINLPTGCREELTENQKPPQVWRGHAIGTVSVANTARPISSARPMLPR